MDTLSPWMPRRAAHRAMEHLPRGRRINKVNQVDITSTNQWWDWILSANPTERHSPTERRTKTVEVLHCIFGVRVRLTAAASNIIPTQTRPLLLISSCPFPPLLQDSLAPAVQLLATQDYHAGV
ncbi:hypothetical protein FRB94_005545 [Tulasnella sp. JGI-2019a]|nr:hypothetical protein FRB94_005545 [Tulasnella sp. JGI-2019a]